MLTKWITSMESFAPIIMPILEMIQPKHIGEIGAAEGGHTRLLYEFLKKTNGRLTTIDPFPRGSFLEWVQTTKPIVNHIADYSFNAIASMNAVDVWFIDGDHNWFTVFNELRLIDLLSKRDSKYPLIYLHDIEWPCGRRDMYYDPTRIPQEFLQPHSAELGVVIDRSESVKGGLRGPHWALKEGGEKNGVLTAVEDFITLTQQTYAFIQVPAVLGLGILIHQNHPLKDAILHYYAFYHQNPILKLLERDRITHYLALVEAQDQLSKVAVT